jgi:hypothetical protein
LAVHPRRSRYARGRIRHCPVSLKGPEEHRVARSSRSFL